MILASIFAAVVLSSAGLEALLNILLFVIGPLVAPFLIVKSAVRAGAVVAGKTAAAPELPTAREILHTRYAGGEIGPEDYDKRRRPHLETP